MIEMVDKKAEAAQVFTVLAELYKPPTLDIWMELEKNHLLRQLQESASKLYNITFLLEDVLPENYDQFCRLYSKYIGFMDKKAVTPVESLFKPWTEDDTCTLPFAREKGYLLGDSALHIKFILDELKIDIPKEYQGIPDHLSILLELAGYFIEYAPEKFTEEFFEDHLDWLAELETQLRKNCSHPFYERITAFLVKVTEEQKTTLLQGLETGDASG